MKIYYTLDELLKDLPNLKDVEITIGYSFEKTIYLDSYKYKSLLAQIKRQKIKIIKQKISDVYNKEPKP